jgi:tRNA pseudouridine13 synthase
MAGQFKATPEDFVVEEIPAYLPSGEGEHLFLWIEKTGLSTPEVVNSLARELKLRERDVSYAGLKDRQAVARQWLCVPARAEPLVSLLAIPQLRVLESRRHRNKLRTGHLKANRFQIRIRHPLDLDSGRAAIEHLRRNGLPNYYGAQRFGRSGENASAGKAVLRGERVPGLDRFRRKLFLSAFQSLLFNRALSARIEGGRFSTAIAGDVMQKLLSGGLFVCEDPAVDQPRIDSFEISPTGPLFGPKMLRPTGEVAAAEAEFLAEEQMALEDFESGGGETQGARRPYRLAITSCEMAIDGDDAWLGFELPKGSYATALLREVLGPLGEPGEELEPL